MFSWEENICLCFYDKFILIKRICIFIVDQMNKSALALSIITCVKLFLSHLSINLNIIYSYLHASS